MNKKEFSIAWKHLCSLYKNPRENHFIRHGCGRETFAYWANKGLVYNYSPNFWKKVLKEAVNRRIAKEIVAPNGYRRYKLHC